MGKGECQALSEKNLRHKNAKTQRELMIFFKQAVESTKFRETLPSNINLSKHYVKTFFKIGQLLSVTLYVDQCHLRIPCGDRFPFPDVLSKRRHLALKMYSWPECQYAE